jgi:hypothetical protein
LPRPYESETRDATTEEIQFTKVLPNRPLMRMQFIKKRKEFNQTYKFGENDSEKNIEFKGSHADPLFQKESKVIEMGYLRD